MISAELFLQATTVNYRTVVLLADVEEFNYKEVTQILRVSIGTVMSRLWSVSNYANL